MSFTHGKKRNNKVERELHSRASLFYKREEHIVNEQVKSFEQILEDRRIEAESNYYRYFLVSKEEVEANPQILIILETKNYAIEPLYDGLRCPGYKVYFDRVTHAQLLEIEWMKKEYRKDRYLYIADKVFGSLILSGLVAYFIFLIIETITN